MDHEFFITLWITFKLAIAYHDDFVFHWFAFQLPACLFGFQAKTIGGGPGKHAACSAALCIGILYSGCI